VIIVDDLLTRQLNDLSSLDDKLLDLQRRVLRKHPTEEQFNLMLFKLVRDTVHIAEDYHTDFETAEQMIEESLDILLQEDK
jgi:hypothetical protein